MSSAFDREPVNMFLISSWWVCEENHGVHNIVHTTGIWSCENYEMVGALTMWCGLVCRCSSQKCLTHLYIR
jgi:hypothetical protein